MIWRFILFSMLLVGAVKGPRLQAQSYTFQVINYCNGLALFPYAMNNAGVIVGEAQTSTSAYSSGFTYYNGKCQTNSFGGRGTSYLGITNTNGIFALYTQTQDVLISGGKTIPAPSYPGVPFSFTSFQNASGVIGGNYYPLLSSAYGTGFLYQNEKFTSLPASASKGQATLYGLNDNNIAVGTFYGYNLSGFILQSGNITYLEFPGATYTYFQGINNNNLIVGSYYMRKTGAVGIFTYSLNTEVWTDLSFPYPYDDATPVGITDSGMIAGLNTASGGLLIATPAGN